MTLYDIYYTGGTVQSGTGDFSWTNPEYSWDKTDDTWASTVLSGTAVSSDILTYTVNDNTLTSDNVYSVVVKTTCSSSDGLNFVYVQPVFSGTVSGSWYRDNVFGYGSATECSFDITFDNSAPDQWAWDNITYLDINCYVYSSNTPASGVTIYIDQIYITVDDALYGMRVYNSSGSMIFDSYSDRLARVLWSDNYTASGVPDTVSGINCGYCEFDELTSYSQILEEDKFPPRGNITGIHSSSETNNQCTIEISKPSDPQVLEGFPPSWVTLSGCYPMGNSDVYVIGES